MNVEKLEPTEAVNISVRATVNWPNVLYAQGGAASAVVTSHLL